MKVILPETDITAASRNSLRDLAVLVDFIFYFFAGTKHIYIHYWCAESRNLNTVTLARDCTVVYVDQNTQEKAFWKNHFRQSQTFTFGRD